MQLMFAFICRVESKSPDGEMEAVGISFDSIFPPALPALYKEFHLVAKLRGTMSETGTKRYEVRLIDPDGRNIIEPLEGTFEFGVPAGRLESYGFLKIRFRNTLFQAYGPHAARLLVDGVEMADVPFGVERIACANRSA